MGVTGRADAEFVQPGSRIHRMILPVPITANDDEIISHVFLKPLADFASFVPKTGIGMIVVFSAAVWTDQGRRADEQLPSRVAFADRLFEPFLLPGAPDRFFRSVRHGVGRAEIAAVGKPDLQIPPPAMRSIAVGPKRNLLSKDALSLSKVQVAHPHARPGIVAESIVVVFLPIARHAPVQFPVPRQARHALPMVARERPVGGSRQLVVVVNIVPRERHEFRSQAQHRGVDVVAVGMIAIVIRLAGHHAELQVAGRLRGRCRFERSAKRAVKRIAAGSGRLDGIMVSRGRFQAFESELMRRIAVGRDVDPCGRVCAEQIQSGAVMHANPADRAGTGAFELVWGRRQGTARLAIILADQGHSAIVSLGGGGKPRPDNCRHGRNLSHLNAVGLPRAGCVGRPKSGVRRRKKRPSEHRRRLRDKGPPRYFSRLQIHGRVLFQLERGRGPRRWNGPLILIVPA